MKITLRRQIQLDVAEMFLSLEREIIRTDIKDYLNGNGYGNHMLDDGIRNYLKKAGIYDEDFRITKYGNDVKETGFFKAKEMGKYRVWIDGERIVFLHRVSADKNNYRRLEPIKLVKEGFSIPINDDGFYRFKLKDSEKLMGNITKECHIDETIQIDENSSSTVFSGTLEQNLSVSDEQIPENVEFNGFSIWDIIEKIFPDDWNKDTKRLKFQIEDLDDNEIEKFKIDFYEDNWSLFKYEIDQLPIEPQDKTEAIEWRNKLLNKEIAQNYLTEKNFDGLVLSINEKEGFSSYKDTMDKPEIKNYLKNEIEPNSSKFWHLYAPMDLNPSIPKEITSGKLVIGNGDSSMLDIVKQINVLNPEFVFYCDRYTDRSYQQKAIAAFLDACGAKTKYVITNTQPNDDKKRSFYLGSQRKDIKVKFLNQQHRRCIVFYKNGEFQIWILDDSIDFIKYNANEKTITPTTIGQIVRSIVFIKVSDKDKDKVLDKEILNFIQQEVKNA
jgi:hypothetical protein